MKRFLALAAILAAGCASGGNTRRVNIDLLQLVGPTALQPIGNFDVQYGVAVENTLNEPVTIRRVEIRQIGTGSYVLARPIDSFPFTKTIPPGATDGVSLWMHAYAVVRAGDFGASEPVSLRVIVFFESPSGSFQQVVHKVLGQFNE